MELQTISQVAKNYGISVRTLRYYEQAGLIKSIRNDDNAYRFYDEATIKHLHFIIILRKLRVSIKQISDILNNQNASLAIEIFIRNISELDEEITSLSVIKSILERFVEELKTKTGMSVQFDLLNDKSTLSIIDSISFSKNYIDNVKEITMDNLNKANETLSKITDMDVRIVYLPPMTVATYCAIGENCEGKANDVINRFVMESNLTKIKPDLRQFGFDCSKGATGIGEPSHAYEVWVSIPDDMSMTFHLDTEVPSSLIKRRFNGGLYAAHVLRTWDFQDWRLLGEWVNSSSKYENAWGESRCTPDESNPGQGFEEYINYFNNANKGFKNTEMQLDLLFPIREKAVE